MRTPLPRPPLTEIYQDLFLSLLNHLRAKLPTHATTPLLVSGKLYGLDSTVIDLCAKVFDCARYRTTKGTVKIHLLLDHGGFLPEYAVITEGKVADINVARKLQSPPPAPCSSSTGVTATTTGSPVCRPADQVCAMGIANPSPLPLPLTWLGVRATFGVLRVPARA